MPISKAWARSDGRQAVVFFAWLKPAQVLRGNRINNSRTPGHYRNTFNLRRNGDHQLLADRNTTP